MANSDFGGFEEAFELTDTGRMAHFSERFGFDLADALAGDVKLASDFFECAAITIDKPETLLEYLAFAFR